MIIEFEPGGNDEGLLPELDLEDFAELTDFRDPVPWYEVFKKSLRDDMERRGYAPPIVETLSDSELFTAAAYVFFVMGQKEKAEWLKHLPQDDFLGLIFQICGRDATAEIVNGPGTGGPSAPGRSIGFRIR